MTVEAFRSEFNLKVDSKGRVSIPAPYRHLLAAGDPNASDTQRPRFLMVYGGENRRYVQCFSMRGAEGLTRRVNQLDIASKERLKADYYFFTQSFEVEIDDDGRVVLPPKVRDKLGMTPEELSKGLEASFNGTNGSFNIWHRRDYDERSAAIRRGDDSVLVPDELMLLLTNTVAEV